ncbi:PAS domain-containing protein [Sporosarcina sp. FSL K6-2383]|uniref:PAS domain-containing protein n=1 Tax=Sporosarcina sp. FSL K6-2383 TaxID=2921556 RepID=UPI00315A0D98
MRGESRWIIFKRLIKRKESYWIGFKGLVVVFANEFYIEMTGYTASEIIGSNLGFLHGEDTDMVQIRKTAQEIMNGQSTKAEVLNYKKDGTPFWNELVIQPIIDERGDNLYTIAFYLDTTERKKGEILLKLQEGIFAGINESEQPTSLIQKIANVIQSFFWQDAVCSILFKEKEGNWYIGAADDVPQHLIDELLEDAYINVYVPGELIVREGQETSHLSGFYSELSMPIVDSDGDVSGLVTIFSQKTRKPTEVQIGFMEKVIPIIQTTKIFYGQQAEYYRLAYTNPETGLPNRHAFLRKFEKDLRDGRNHFAAIIEPGEYTKIVDLYGGEAADELFIQLSRRIERVGIGGPNFVGRFASSALVFTNEPLPGDNGVYIIELNQLVAKPFMIAGQEMFITLKIGVALLEEGLSGEGLLRRADTALSDAKKKSGNAISFYKDLQYEETRKEMKVFNELSKALLTNEIEVYLQPQVDLQDGSVISFEALARWFSPTLG